MNDTNRALDDSVTVSVSRRVLPGKEHEYEEWVSGVSHAASQFSGHMGTNILRPQGAQQNYVIIYRFDSFAHAHVWEESPEREQWIIRLADLVEGEAETKRVSGLEFWFELPAVPVGATAPRYKMALLLMVVVYVLVVSLNIIFTPLIKNFPFYIKLLLIIPTQVLLMTYVVMPRVTRLFKKWIYA